MEELNPTIENVVTAADLEAACSAMLACDAIALDTEFIRVNTYYPIAGLIQVGLPGHCYLIDPLTISDLEPFARVLRQESLVKVLHACSEDLEVFKRLLGQLPHPLFDTQVAAALAGPDFSLSYQNLVEQVTGVTLSKGETRSNWLQRPLTASQCHYAAQDVNYLLAIHAQQVALLETQGREAWIREDCDAIVKEAAKEKDPGEYYRRISAAWILDPEALMVLKLLSTWREIKAKAVDRPRNRIVSDRSMLIIAREAICDRGALIDLAEMLPQQVRKYGDELLEKLAEFDTTGQGLAAIAAPLSRGQNLVLKRLTKRVREIATSLNMAPEMLIRKRQLEDVLKDLRDGGDQTMPVTLQGWRHAVLSKELNQLIRELAFA